MNNGSIVRAGMVAVLLLGLPAAAQPGPRADWVDTYDTGVAEHGVQIKPGFGEVVVLGLPTEWAPGYVQLSYSPEGELLGTVTTTDRWLDTVAFAREGRVLGAEFLFVRGGRRNYDITTVLYDEAGNELWAQTYGGEAQGIDRAIAFADTASGVYVLALSANEERNYDIVLLQYDSNGNLRREVRYDNPLGTNDIPKAMWAGHFGLFVYLTGVSGSDFLTMRVSHRGSVEWVSTYEADVQDAWSHGPSAIVRCKDGSIVVTGFVQRPNRGSILTLKYDYRTGDLLWAHEFSRDGLRIKAVSDMVCRDGYIYVVGDAFKDSITLKYDSDGTLLWDTLHGSDLPDHSAKIVVDHLGNTFVTGLGSSNYRGVSKVTTTKLDADGQLVWRAIFPESPNLDDGGLSVALDGSGHVYVTGGLTMDDDPENGDILTVRYIDRCAGDYNGDGTADIRDIVAFLGEWRHRDSSTDFNDSGNVDAEDVHGFLSAWAQGCL